MGSTNGSLRWSSWRLRPARICQVPLDADDEPGDAGNHQSGDQEETGGAEHGAEGFEGEIEKLTGKGDVAEIAHGAVLRPGKRDPKEGHQQRARPGRDLRCHSDGFE